MVTVMPTTGEPDGDIAALSTNELFVDLLCADEDLLRAEFDAIIAAEWPGQPPDEPGYEDSAGRPRRARHHRKSSDPAPFGQPHHPRIGGWTRPRSPPPAPAPERRTHLVARRTAFLTPWSRPHSGRDDGHEPDTA